MRNPWTSNIFQSNREPVRAERARGGLARYLLIVLLPLVLGPLITVALLLYRQSQGDITAQVLAQLTSLSSLKENQIDEWTSNRGAEMNFLAAAPDVLVATQTLIQPTATPADIRAAQVTLQTRFNAYINDENNANFIAILLANAETGEVVLATDNGQAILGQNFIDEDYFRTARSASVTFAPLEYDPRLSATSIVLVAAAPIVDTRLGVIGVLLGLIPNDRLLDIVQPSPGLGVTGRSFIVTSDGFILGNPVTPGQPRAASDGIVRALVHHEDGNGQYPSEGQTVVGVYNWLDRHTIALLVEQSVSEAYAPLAKAGTIFAGTIALAAIISVLGVLIVTRQLTAPIQALTESALRMAGGDLQVQTHIQREDEIGLLAQAFDSMTTQLRDLYNTLESRVNERTRQLAAAAEVGRVATASLNSAELMTRAVELIRTRFGYYHASIFLLDEAGEFAVLREATGQAGEQLKLRGHKIPVGSSSLISAVIAQHAARVVTDEGPESAQLKSEFQPETRAEVALPLLVGERVIGVLDVHSRQLHAFGGVDLEALQIVADQLAVAIENGRLFGRQARLIQMEQLLFEFANKIHQSPQLDTILESAAFELGRVFNATKAVVRLRPEARRGSPSKSPTTPSSPENMA